ncbi:MAG TPA: PAS domain-containing protein, partial [Ramlibacter sp.]
DGQGEITWLNQHWVDYTGHPARSTVGRSWDSVLREQDADATGLAWPQAHAAREGFGTEVRLRRRDGLLRWWLMRGVPVFDGEGRLLKWLGTCTDIDELKLAEMRISQANAELQRQRTELRALFDLVPAMIWSKDTHNNFVRVNERAARSIGRTVEEVEGRSAWEMYPAEADAFFASDQDTIRSNKPAFGQIEVAIDDAGTQRWFQKDKVPFHDEHGNVIGVLVMSHDITERKRDQDALRELNADLEERVCRRTAELALARDAAERANQAKSTFLATMSHEIRTPMSGLLGLLELLEFTDLDAEQRDTLQVARESGRALQRLIDGILDFSKIEANSLELDVRPSSIRAVVDNAYRLHGQAAAAKNLALASHVDPAISDCLLFDPLRLGQILNNLLGNAIKFTERGGIRVDVERLSRTAATEDIRFSVRDTGIGIAPEQVGRLFKPFAQASAQTSTMYGGTGLGLFISRRLAEMMGGELRLDSFPGRGTVLTLEVAFATCADEAPAVPPAASTHDRVLSTELSSAARSGQESGCRLLIVDDHPINRLVLLRQSAALGYPAEAFENGVEALQAWEGGGFAAVVTDCNMPGMSGFDLARRIRAAEAARGASRMPIVGCTANALPSAAAACLDAGMDDVVIKPVDLASLSETLRRLLRGRGAQEAATAGPQDAPLRLPPNHGLLDLAMIAAISRGDPAARRRVLEQF